LVGGGGGSVGWGAGGEVVGVAVSGGDVSAGAVSGATVWGVVGLVVVAPPFGLLVSELDIAVTVDHWPHLSFTLPRT
jgi:hypothetical protein